MKKSITLYIISVMVFLFVISGCNKTDIDSDIWKSAVYTEDTEFGSGEKTIKTEVIVNDKSVTFTVNTDKENLADALTEHDIISGEDGPYGLYIKKVNGIVADYDENASYWSLSKDGEYMQTGVSDTVISDGEHYELTYTK